MLNAVDRALDRIGDWLANIDWKVVLTASVGWTIPILFETAHGEQEFAVMFAAYFRSFPYLLSIALGAVFLNRGTQHTYALALGVCMYAVLDCKAMHDLTFLPPRSSTDGIIVAVLPSWGCFVIPIAACVAHLLLTLTANPGLLRRLPVLARDSAEFLRSLFEEQLITFRPPRKENLPKEDR
jgi:hypothetical protein